MGVGLFSEVAVVETHADFLRRLKLLGRKHARMTHGYSARVRQDGLIVLQPRRLRRGFPLRGTMLLLAGFFCFKAFMLAAIGPVTYGERLAKLSNGTVVEQAGAWLLAMDPLTDALAGAMGPVLR
ncbi:hypothetical protein ACFSUD_00145 [Sulfitobacter aestuarii]|uniref:Uncharacterized protein n=1 Tax=Sulfitobacter aestuarii TaxID=2161676 RepID=A0ABW5TXL8_9RHOB